MEVVNLIEKVDRKIEEGEIREHYFGMTRIRGKWRELCIINR